MFDRREFSWDFNGQQHHRLRNFNDVDRKWRGELFEETKYSKYGAFRRKTGAARRFLIYALWATFVRHKGFLTSGRWVGRYNKNIESRRARASFFPFFLPSLVVFLSLKVESVPGTRTGSMTMTMTTTTTTVASHLLYDICTIYSTVLYLYISFVLFRASSFRSIEYLLSWILTSSVLIFRVPILWNPLRPLKEARASWDLLRNATKSSSVWARWSTRHGWARWVEWEKSTTREWGPSGRRREDQEMGEERGSEKRAVTMAASITRFDAHGLFQHYAPWQVSHAARYFGYTDPRFQCIIEFSVSTSLPAMLLRNPVPA